jgi:hypothetical protein
VVPFYFTARGPLPQTRFNCRKKKRLHPLPYNSSSFNSLALSIHNKQHHRSSSITHSHITLANFSFVNLVLIFRCSSSTTNPVYERSVNLLVLVCSLSSHRHSYHSFYLYLSLYRFIINNIFRPSYLNHTPTHHTRKLFSSINLVSISETVSPGTFLLSVPEQTIASCMVIMFLPRNTE